MNFVDFTGFAWLLSLIGLGAAAGIYGYVKKQPPGNETMIDIGEQIHDGAMAFLRREYTVLAGFVVVVAILLNFAIGLETAGAYIFGALSSVLAGFSGMKAATRANTRTASAANTDGQGKALRVAFFGGAVMGLAGPPWVCWASAPSTSCTARALLPLRSSRGTPRSSPGSPWVRARSLCLRV
jgi:K(+)-stimulated pyrophosphate-energized sodium pump